VALLIAAKFTDDLYFKNEFWGLLGGISLKELNFLEYVFLHRVAFKLMYTEELFKRYASSLY
jgi:hypothetical protein